jgi:hypothetical protein
MKYTLEVTERVNLGNFEFVECKAGIEFTDEDAVDAGESPHDFGLRELDALLLSHRRRARSLVPEEADSFALVHPALEEQ